MAKLNLETIAVIGGVGYLAVAYFMKLFPFDGTLDDVLGEIKGVAGGEPATGTDPAAIDPLTGKIGPAINPAAGAAEKELSELQLLAQMKSQYQTTAPLITGDIQGIGDTTIYNPAIPGTPVIPVPPAVPAEEDEIEACSEWCTGECNKLTGAAKTKCAAACASVCATGAGATETDEEESTIPATPAEEEEEEEEEEIVAKPNRSLCSSKFNGKCNTECKSPNSGACKECQQVCGSSSNYARSYFTKRAFPGYGYPVKTHDYVMPVPRSGPMLVRGRARSGFRSYSTEAGFDSLRGKSTIKVRRFAMSS